jgi:hypothetical protein
VAADANSHMADTPFLNPAAESNGSVVAEPVARVFLGSKESGDSSIVEPAPSSHESLLQAAAAGVMPDHCWRTDGEFPSRLPFSATDHPGEGDPCLSADERDVGVWGNWGAHSERLEGCTGQLDESDPALNDIAALSHGSECNHLKACERFITDREWRAHLAAHAGQAEAARDQQSASSFGASSSGGSAGDGGEYRSVDPGKSECSTTPGASMAAQERRRRKFAASVREVQEKASKAVELSDHLRARGLRMDTRDATVFYDWEPTEAIKSLGRIEAQKFAGSFQVLSCSMSASTATAHIN